MIEKILIIGASGSGTTTLGNALSEKLNYKHFDSDDYFWVPPKLSFSEKRERSECQRLLKKDLTENKKWILSGSLCGWGDIFIPYFELVVYLYLPKDIRMDRLIKREYQRYGKAIDKGGEKYDEHLEFIDWASKYDEGGLDIRSKATHREWMNQLGCPMIKIFGDYSVDERMEIILDRIHSLKSGQHGIVNAKIVEL